MYAIRDDNYKNNIYTDKAEHELKIVIDGVEIVPTIRNLKYSGNAISGETFTYGHACSRYIEVEIDKDIIDSLESTNEFYFEEKVTIGASEYTTPIGYFYTESKDTTNDYYVTFKLYDKMYFLTTPYIGSEFIQNNHRSRRDIAEDICDKNGLYLANHFFGEERICEQFNDDLTAKEWFTFLSERAGGFAQIGREKNADGKLPLYIKTFKETDHIEVPENMLGDNTISDTYKVSRVSRNLLESYGNDTGIEVMLSQDSILEMELDETEAIYNKTVGTEYTNVSVQTWDDTNIDVGDQITIGGLTFIAQPQMTWGNGFYGTYDMGIKPYQKGTTITKLTTASNKKYLNKKINELENGFEVVVEEVGQMSKNMKVADTKTGNPVETENASADKLLNITIKGKTVNGESVKGTREEDGGIFLTLSAKNEKGESRIICSIDMSAELISTENGGDETIQTEAGLDLTTRGEVELRSLNGVYDEFVNGEVIQRIGVDNTGNLYVLEDEKKYKVDFTLDTLYNGYNMITDSSGLEPELEVKYLFDSEINTIFAKESQMTILQDKITTSVSESTEAKVIAENTRQELANKVDGGEFTSYQETISSQFDQLPNSFEFTLNNTTLANIFDDKKEGYDKEYQVKIELNKYIRFGEDPDGLGPIIELGVDGDTELTSNNVKAVLTSSGLYFVPAGTKDNWINNAIAYYTGDTMYVKKSINLQSVTIGDENGITGAFRFETYDDGSMSLGKVKRVDYNARTRIR